MPLGWSGARSSQTRQAASSVQPGDLAVGHASVLRLYWAFFEREPDTAGGAYWIDVFNGGASIDDIALSFSESEEFVQTYGDTSDREFVRIVYSNVLGRSPDGDGFAYWTGLLSGTGANRVDVVRWISASTEFISAHPFRSAAVTQLIASDTNMAAAVDVVESIVGGHPTAYLPLDRDRTLTEGIAKLSSRYGRFSTVAPANQCTSRGSVHTCPIAVTEVGLSTTVNAVVVAGKVVDLSESSEVDDPWALDAVHSAVVGRTVVGSRGMSPEALKVIASNVDRIAPSIGTRAGAVIDPSGVCANGVLPAANPGAAPLERRACTFSVAGPLLTLTVEAVTHDGTFAGINVKVPRSYTEQAFIPYATIGDVTLHLPANRVERIGFHESGHDGSQAQAAIAGETKVMTLASRRRGNDPRSAADIVVHPEAEIRSPVTGTVLRAGTYTLYCKYSDHYLVIEPDARPGYEVKVLHFEGLSVAKGDRVVAGQTKVGANARKLPFDSQVDDFTADPSSGHIHIEVVDPSIPDRPSGGGC